MDHDARRTGGHTADTADTADRTTGRTLVRRMLTTTGVVAVFLGGLGVGVALPEDTTELEAAGADAAQTRQEVADLELELQDLAEANEQLAGSLDEAKESAASSAALDAREEALDRREARLEERVDALHTREEALGAAVAAPGASDEDDETDEPADHPGRALGFDRAWANHVVRDIRADLRTVDQRLRTGSGVGSALSLLGDSYGRLAQAGTPAGVDEADYRARLSTLEAFAATAADEYLVNPTEGRARYAVVRDETEVLFETLNTALGSNYRLP